MTAAHTPYLPVTASVLDANALLRLVLPSFAMPAPAVSCRLHMSGVNDLYRVEARDGRTYFLKMYRTGWRTRDDVLYEVGLLRHLHERQIGVASPVPLLDGSGDVLSLTAPEGERQAVLFQAAPGRQPRWPFYEDADECRRIGTALARFHQATDDFASPHARPALDAARLLDEPIAAVRPYLDGPRPDEWRRFVEVTERFRARLDAVDRMTPPRGICHGDFHAGNVFVGGDDENAITLFDFDVCGPGWLAYDLACWKDKTSGKPPEAWDAFRAGYVSVRPLTRADDAALPLLETLQLLRWTRAKFSFIARGAWDDWDANFFLDGVLERLEKNAAPGE